MRLRGLVVWGLPGGGLGFGKSEPPGWGEGLGPGAAAIAPRSREPEAGRPRMEGAQRWSVSPVCPRATLDTV